MRVNRSVEGLSSGRHRDPILIRFTVLLFVLIP